MRSTSVPPQRRRVRAAGGGAATAVAYSFESPTAEVLARHFPATERATLYVLCLMVVAIAALISFAKVDRVVTTAGRLVPTTGALTVQPLQTQIISRILVSVGDVVKKGAVLATCDPTFTEADRVRLTQQVTSLDAEIRRRTAEDEKKPFAPIAGNSYDQLQAQIFAQRQSEYSSGLSDFDQRISSAQAQGAGLAKNITDYRSRQKIVGEMEGMHSALAKDGYVSRLQWLNVRDQQVDISQKLSDAQSSLASAQHILESLREQRRGYVEKWRDDNLTALVTARNAMDAAKQDLAKADKMSELVNLVSPADAIVTRTPVLTSGGVATGAQPLFNLVPLDAPLEAQIQIDSQDIGFVKEGDPVTIKFDAFKFLEHGVAKGVVKTVSQDSFTDGGVQEGGGASATSQGRSAYFDARVRITDVQLHDVPKDFRPIPGMTVTADILVGHRTILWYLVGGGLRTGAEALREP